MSELISLREYARRRKVTLGAVQKAIKSGRITALPDAKGRPKIDPEVADVQWARNTDPVQSARANGGLIPENSAAGGVDPIGDTAGGAGLVGTAAPGASQAPESADYNREKARREAAMAALAELELAEKRGQLLNGVETRKAIFEAAGTIRDRQMAIADRCSADLAAESDPQKVHKRISDELRMGLQELTELLKKFSAD